MRLVPFLIFNALGALIMVGLVAGLGDGALASMRSTSCCW